MPDRTGRPLLQSLTDLTGVDVHPLVDLPVELQHVAMSQVAGAPGRPARFQLGAPRYLAIRFDRIPSSVLVAGPYRLNGDSSTDSDYPLIDSDLETRLTRAMLSVSEAFAQMTADRKNTDELATSFELMNNAVVAISTELSLETVLRRIVDLARSIAGAKYAALGVPGPGGELEKFVTSGIGEDAIQAIGTLPRGRGLLGTLINKGKALRIRNIADHPDSVGFPENHPPMSSFLGVPIAAHGQVLGNLYLTEKRFAPEFSEEDERLVELLARHAAIAIENARLYEQLEAQEQRLRFIIEQLPEAVIQVEVDPERVTIANRKASEVLGWELTPPIPFDEFLARNRRIDASCHNLPTESIPIVRALRRGEIVIRSEVQLERPDGTMLTLLANAAPLRQPDGTVIAATLVFQDITLIKDAEQLKDDFLSLVSHELRTPLTTIHGGAHLLIQGSEFLDDVTRTEITGDILSESRRLASLVENMVQLANIRAGRFQIQAEPVHIGMLIRRAVRGLGESANRREIHVDETHNLLALGDTDSLDQVLRNLLQNAIKYVPDDTPIKVETRHEDGQVLIAVRDFGPGIDTSDLPQLFERFQRGRGKETTAGMGLGLYLSRMIVEANGGQLWVELPPDGGTRFVFSLPRAADEFDGGA